MVSAVKVLLLRLEKHKSINDFNRRVACRKRRLTSASHKTLINIKRLEHNWSMSSPCTCIIVCISLDMWQKMQTNMPLYSETFYSREIRIIQGTEFLAIRIIQGFFVYILWKLLWTDYSRCARAKPCTKRRDTFHYQKININTAMVARPTAHSYRRASPHTMKTKLSCRRESLSASVSRDQMCHELMSLLGPAFEPAFLAVGSLSTDF